MPDAADFRYVEILVDGNWIREKFSAIKKDDTVRIFESDGELVGTFRATSSAFLNDYGIGTVEVLEHENS